MSSSSQNNPPQTPLTQSNRDAWAALRDEMTLEEVLYETTRRAKLYNRNNYGLLGILKVIRMTDPDLNILALGIDLTTLGLNLNSSECLFSTFTSPWDDKPSQKYLDFTLPSCYLQSTTQLKLSHMQKFKDSTLIYIFYNMPRDVLQGYAAAELYNRRWIYHKQYKKWFCKHLDGEGTTKGEWTNTRHWQYFEPSCWEMRTYMGRIDSKGFLPIEDIRASLDDPRNQVSGFENSSYFSTLSALGATNVTPGARSTSSASGPTTPANLTPST